jgi:hypothetical protein
MPVEILLPDRLLPNVDRVIEEFSRQPNSIKHLCAEYRPVRRRKFLAIKRQKTARNGLQLVYWHELHLVEHILVLCITND